MLLALLERGGGVVTRRVVTEVVPEWVLWHACHAGLLLRVLPGVYVDADLAPGEPGASGEEVGPSLPPAQAGPNHEAVRVDRPLDAPAFLRLEPGARRRAALAYADGRAALSCLTALDVWGLRRQPVDEPVHLDAPRGSGVRPRLQLAVHHRQGFVVGPPQVVTRAGMPVVRLEQALVDAWPLLPVADRPAPVIRAVNDRLTTPERIAAALDRAPRVAGRAELRTLLDRLRAGCRSPLEIWGHDHAFTGPGMPSFQRQKRIVIGRRTMYLDVWAERERVDFELDGAATHADPRQREVDLRRDALLATAGILVVRFAHRRLVHETDAVRREVLAILASRRPSA